MQSNQEREKTLDLSNLWIDTGLEAEEVKKKKVHGVDVVALKQNVMISKYRITSKALDDKIGVYVIAECYETIG